MLILRNQLLKHVGFLRLRAVEAFFTRGLSWYQVCQQLITRLKAQLLTQLAQLLRKVVCERFTLVNHERLVANASAKFVF